MLLEIRERAQGWVAWAIVILISIPFALWGIQSYLGGGGEPAVATVNGAEITEQQLNQNLQRTRVDLRERLGDAYDPALFEDGGLRERVLDRMIESQVLLDASGQLGLRVADAVLRSAIAQEPAFQKDGHFDKATYAQVLQYQGLSPAAFEQNLRLQLLQTQLERAVESTAFAPQSEVDQSIRLIRQEREISYIKLPQADFAPGQSPDEEKVRAFYDENPDRFKSPEQVKLSYILLSPELLGADQTVSEEDLQALYEERAETLKTPEMRSLRHILIALPADADEASIDAAREKAAAARERILAGEAFASVASDVSDDPVSAAAGGDLGQIERGMLDPVLEQTAFSLNLGDLSEPVRSRFGYHLLEVTAVEPSVMPSFDDVAGELRKELQSRSAEGAFYDHAERLATRVYEVPDSLVPAAEELGLDIQTSDWIDRSGGAGIFASQKVVAAAFSEEVLGRGNNSELIEPDPQRLEALVLRVDEHRPEAVRPLKEVREEIVQLLNAREAAAAALQAAEALSARIEQGESLPAVAGETYPVEAPGMIERQSGELPAAVVREAFLLPRPGVERPSVGTATDGEGDAFVIAVSAVRDGSVDDLTVEARAAEARVLAQSLGRSDFTHVVSGLEASAKIERKALASDQE
ncbi:SurA N-terminal domain-containing protein [Thiorhodovibrio frisius]|uniref:Periplasmic chaperone PpiD n=1 Tax=Thiorhodovibrio frisius TaxID=631362 RepID=H8YZC9_9GAMM|nr:SurA N-terminal domain-containing protein [Thiorhodovibrio frisius]EIC22056.1 parvulin-like peptidyl-prolyl isomerase [Thiorhodovibrio frisius]WPL24347.1 Peptidyl-prolyl cis-trans isomerase D [Thiorhodovibrio frisius]